MSRLTDEADRHLTARVRLSYGVSRKVLALWRTLRPEALDAGWDRIAPDLERVLTVGQVNAATQATRYVGRVERLQGAAPLAATLVPEAFGGATREGREVVPELYASVTTTKSLIGRGMPVPQAFRAGAAFMSVIAATMVRDAGRGADQSLSVGRGSKLSVRVVQPGACSRCAILAGVTGYRVDFDRHPGCRCTSMPLYDDEIPDGFFRTPGDYFDSLSESEQERVFTKAGADAIRLGADPVKVVNARRGALKSTKRADGSYSLAQLRPVQIGRSADGSPLMVYATPEGTTARSAWARGQSSLVKNGDERYRRTTMVRLMPEQIMSMASTPERARELLARYGYIR